MHSLHALALMQEKRMARLGSRWMRIQRKPSSTLWPASKGTSKVSTRPGELRLIFSLAIKPHAIAREADRLASEPGVARRGEVFALVSAAALGARERGAGDAFGDQAHLAQVVPVEPHRVEARTGRRQLLALGRERHDALERAREAGLGAQGSDVAVHESLQAGDFSGRVQVGRRGAGRARRREIGS